MSKIKNRKIVVVNQAVNYLTVGLCNTFSKRFETVSLITGNIHEQGEKLSSDIHVTKINKYQRAPDKKKIFSYLSATLRIYILLITKYRTYDVFFISTPPMAYLLTILISNRSSMLIWDVYPDIFKITGMDETHYLYRFWAYLNRIVFKKAYRLFTIGNKMATLLGNYTDRDKILVTPIWSIFQSNSKLEKKENPFVIEKNLQDKFVVQYSGNIGLTHNVEILIEIAEKMENHKDILFQIIGKGSKVTTLERMIEEKELNNCQLLPFQSDEMFPYSLSAADLGVVILEDETSKGSVPSKSYNLMSFGIPSLYIAANDSELYDYAERYGHAECFHKDDINSIIGFIEKLKNVKSFKDRYSENALKAAKNYRRSNADEIVDLYIK